MKADLTRPIRRIRAPTEMATSGKEKLNIHNTTTSDAANRHFASSVRSTEAGIGAPAASGACRRSRRKIRANRRKLSARHTSATGARCPRKPRKENFAETPISAFCGFRVTDIVEPTLAEVASAITKGWAGSRSRSVTASTMGAKIRQTVSLTKKAERMLEVNTSKA